MRRLILAGVVGLIGAGLIAQEPIPQDRVVEIAKKLADVAEKVKEPPIKITPDPASASGLYAEGRGIVIIPQQGLKEAGENLKGVEDPTGAAIAYLVLYKIGLGAEGKAVEAAKLPTVSVKRDNGDDVEVTLLRLAVKKESDSEYKLLVFGKDKNPLASSMFKEDQKNTDQILSLSIKDAADGKATLVIHAHGKYAAEVQLVSAS